MNLTKFARRNQRNILVVTLSAACFLPAIIIGAVNAPRVNVETISKPFKLVPIGDEGASYPAPKVEPVAPVIQLQEIVIWGDKRPAKLEEPTKPTPVPTFIHQSVNGGAIRVIGFDPEKPGL